MRRRAGAGRAELHLRFVGLGVSDELLEIVRRQVLARDQHDRHFGDQADGREVGRGVVQGMRVERLALRVRADGAEHEGVAVGLGFGDALGAGLAAGAADVLNDDVLLQDLAHLRGNDAAEQVGRSAGGERDHHGHRAGREILRTGVAGHCHSGHEREAENCSFHSINPPPFGGRTMLIPLAAAQEGARGMVAVAISLR